MSSIRRRERRTRSRSRHALAAGALLAALLAAGCGDDGDEPRSVLDAALTGIREGGTDKGVRADAAGQCVSVDAGSSCETGMHCASGRCEVDYCGDGIRNGTEQCDDGNQLPGDGCDPACRSEFHGCGDGKLDAGEECDDGNRIDNDACANDCTKNVCGNSRIDVGEECDDGNYLDTDDCSNHCTINECRNGRLDPGEECDDGNTNDFDGCTNDCMISICGDGKVEKHETCDDGTALNGDSCPSSCVNSTCGNGVVEVGEACDGVQVEMGGKFWNCSADCKTKEEASDCEKCQNEQCSSYMGVDLVSGCFVKVDPEYGAVAGDPTFIQDCIDVVTCALVHECGLGSILDGVDGSRCYCGSASVDECAAMGPAADAPCIQEWQSAAKSQINTEVQGRFTDLSYATGWAYYLLDCYSSPSYCGAVCVPK